MKNIKYYVIALIICLICSIGAISQTNTDITKYNCFTAPVKYLVEGSKTDGLLVFMNYSESEMPALHLSNVYILNKKGQNMKLVGDSNAFASVYDMKVSPDSKYLANYCVGEGHPWIEVYDLQKLVESGTIDLVGEINPYPGNVDLLSWQGNKLVVESDINLLLKNESKDMSDTDMFEKSKKFLFDVETKKFKAYK